MNKKSHPVTPALDRAFYIIGWTVLGVIAAYFLFCSITEFQLTRHLAPCFFHAMTGLYCPGCGGTRAVLLFLHGNFLKSFLYHPIVIYTVLVGGYFMISQTIGRIAKKEFRFVLHYHDWMLWVAMILIIANFFIKNLFLLVWGIDLLPLK